MGIKKVSKTRVGLKKPEISHSVQGSWRGRYFYASDSTPNGFEAVFIEVNGAVEGSILDDGRLGEAFAGGTFVYPQLKFVKRYRSANTDPVNYQGVMSEDGKQINGTWMIKTTHPVAGSVVTYGTWTARRMDEGEELKFQERREEVEEEEKEKVLTEAAPSKR